MTESLTPTDRPIHVEIVTPVFNRRETTLQCLRSLARIDKTGLKVHVIVVDDGSSDGTTAAINEQFPDVEVLQGTGDLFFTKGTNKAVAHALTKDPDYILGINDDSIFHEQFLQRLVRCARENPRSVVGSVLLLWDQPHRVAQVGARWQTWYGGWRMPHHYSVFDLPKEPFDVDIIVGNCVMYPAAAIREVGLMKEAPFRYGFGDLEWTPRMKRAGWRLLIEPRSLMWFEPNTLPPSPSEMPVGKLLKMLFRNRIHPHNLRNQFFWRWHSAPSRPAAFVAFFIHQARLMARWIGLDRKWPYWPDEAIPTARMPVGKRS